MKFPHGLKALRQEFFPTEAEQMAASEAAFAERERAVAEARVAKEAAALEAARALKQSCAERLQPHLGRLMLVTNFKGRDEAERARRIARAVASTEEFKNINALGISVHTTHERLAGSEAGFQGLSQTGRALMVALQAQGYDNPRYEVPLATQREYWLYSIVQTAEDTARTSRNGAFGHIAVVGALDIKFANQVDIPGYVDPGTAFRLVNIDEDGRLCWEFTSFDPNSTYVDEQAVAEDMRWEFRNF